MFFSDQSPQGFDATDQEKTFAQFPEKLWRAADAESDLIQWTNDGTSIAVNAERFETEVFRTYPNLVRIASFQNFRRQMREYGFRWSHSNNKFPAIYYFSHPFFGRSCPELLSKVTTRRKSRQHAEVCGSGTDDEFMLTPSSKKSKVNQVRRSYEIPNKRAKTKARLKTGLTNAKRVPRPKRSKVGKKRACSSCLTCTSSSHDIDDDFSDDDEFDLVQVGPHPVKIIKNPANNLDMYGRRSRSNSSWTSQDSSFSRTIHNTTARPTSYLATSVTEDSIRLIPVHNKNSHSAADGQVNSDSSGNIKPNNVQTKVLPDIHLVLGQEEMKYSAIDGTSQSQSQTQVYSHDKTLTNAYTNDTSQAMISANVRLSPSEFTREGHHDTKPMAFVEQSPPSVLAANWLMDDVLGNGRDDPSYISQGPRKNSVSPKQPSKKRYRLSACQPTFPQFCANPHLHTPSAPPACWCTHIVQPQLVHPPPPHLPAQPCLPTLYQSPPLNHVIAQSFTQNNFPFLQDPLFDNNGLHSTGYNTQLFEFIETGSPKLPPPHNLTPVDPTLNHNHINNPLEEKLPPGKCVVHGSEYNSTNGLDQIPSDPRTLNLISSHDLNFHIQGPAVSSGNDLRPREMSPISSMIAESEGVPFIPPIEPGSEASPESHSANMAPITFGESHGPPTMPEPSQEVIVIETDPRDVLIDPESQTQQLTSTPASTILPAQSEYERHGNDMSYVLSETPFHPEGEASESATALGSGHTWIGLEQEDSGVTEVSTIIHSGLNILSDNID